MHKTESPVTNSETKSTMAFGDFLSYALFLRIISKMYNMMQELTGMKNHMTPKETVMNVLRACSGISGVLL